ncbi:unnamed protein product [marine sediment metagenome]|uniref:Uncharacterized protein n=1 Tax=marine sediment metagenome TaxID=412755 RepID=X1GRH6_9ZZZZ
MDEGMKAMREQPLVMRIENLLEEVEKETYSLRNEIHGINEKLLPATVVRDISESEKTDKEIPKGWFVKIVRKLETIRKNLREIDAEEIRKLKGATGLLGPNVKELKGDEGGC